MAIPNNISADDIKRAVGEIDPSKIPVERRSHVYFLLEGGKILPPKYVISVANKYSNNHELNWDSFNAVEAVGFLKGLKFNTRERFYQELVNFLDIARKQVIGQGTKETAAFNQQRITEYKSLTVDVSFGTGRASAIPWISFLAPGQATSKGIYPVYLYFKEKNLLILAYGISETNPSTKVWNVSGLQTIEQYFADNKLGKPERYGSSYVFKSYDLANELDEDQVNNDLDKLISIYKKTLGTIKIKELEKFDYKYFHESISQAGLVISERIALRFIASILTKPFVILTGLSGSGKTKLAQAFVTWICDNENQYCIIPVGADWTNREPLLGFPNALNGDDYMKPDSGVLDIIISADANPDVPYFLILDEMNLSHVERYFADFLSVMESNGKISLHSGTKKKNNVPPEINLPKNLFVIGTVNIDETTYMFSPKVLDRASVIEFRVTAEEMDTYLSKQSKVDFESLKAGGANMAEAFIQLSRDESLRTDIAALQTALLIFFSELKKAGAEFGYRSASEILRFASVINAIEPNWKITEIIDAAIMQKLLPKVHGSRRKLEPILKTLGSLCLTNGQEFDAFINPNIAIEYSDADKIKYPISFEKILRMYHGLIDNGFTSYAEA